MSLGTIAHLQHYFARTGLLDGKGAQLAREDQQKNQNDSLDEVNAQSAGSSLAGCDTPSTNARVNTLDLNHADDASLATSVDGIPLEGIWEDDHLNLPPTASTYKQKPTYIPPPPNLPVLRHELREALEDARRLLADIQADEDERSSHSHSQDSAENKSSEPHHLQGWYEIQGLQVLDLVTLAIRAAKNFYTSHEQPRRLYSIQSERKIRSDLFDVLETLKKLAGRNFAGGIRKAERDKISSWGSGIEQLVLKDENLESQEYEQRQRWPWLNDEWCGREREREWCFLKSFDLAPNSLPPWSPPSDTDSHPSSFLASMQNGLRLVSLHNEMVKSSRRQFELIKNFHTDTGKPYRRAENLRYWIKAAQLRWDVRLDVDVHGVVHSTGAAAWQRFDEALLRWCRTVREEITNEWQEHQETLKTERPIVRMDRAADMNAVW